MFRTDLTHLHICDKSYIYLFSISGITFPFLKHILPFFLQNFHFHIFYLITNNYLYIDVIKLMRRRLTGVLGCKFVLARQERSTLEENTGVKEDVANPSTEANTEQTSVPAESSQAKEDPNWKEAREVMRQQQMKIQELENHIHGSKKPDSDFDELDSLGSDDIVTVGQARKLAAQVAERTAREISEKNQAEMRKLETYSRHTDFESVVTPENIKKLELEYPSIAEGISKSSNPHKGAYEAIKTLFKRSEKTVSEAAKKAEENLNKPQSVHSQGYQGALSEVKNFEDSTLSSERKHEIWNLSKKYAASR